LDGLEGGRKGGREGWRVEGGRDGELREGGREGTTHVAFGNQAGVEIFDGLREGGREGGRVLVREGKKGMGEYR